ncbi:MAG: hypothetical protein ACOC8X_09560 [Chloroflexota bacterium]
MPDTTVLEQLIKEAIDSLHKEPSAEERDRALRLMLMVSLHNLKATQRFHEVAESWREYPSLTWLLRFRTKPTLVVLGTIITLVLALAGMGLWSFVARLLGVPIA